MDFGVGIAIGFATGSAVTFLVLLAYGLKGMVSEGERVERIIQQREEQVYQAGYVNGFQDGQIQSTTISNLPVNKN